MDPGHTDRRGGVHLWPGEGREGGGEGGSGGGGGQQGKPAGGDQETEKETGPPGPEGGRGHCEPHLET